MLRRATYKVFAEIETFLAERMKIGRMIVRWLEINFWSVYNSCSPAWKWECDTAYDDRT